MKKRALLGSLILLAAPVAIAQVTIRVNGEAFTVNSWSMNQSGSVVELTTSPALPIGRTDDSPVTPPTTPPVVEPEPPVVTPPPPVGSGACVETESLECGVIDWANPGPRINDNLIGTSKVISWEFTTTPSTAYAGTISVSESTNASSTTRRIWISTTPAGPTLNNSFRCESEGVTQRNINWSQQANRFRCALQPNTSYFLNLQNTANCRAGQPCGYYRSIVTN